MNAFSTILLICAAVGSSIIINLQFFDLLFRPDQYDAFWHVSSKWSSTLFSLAMLGIEIHIVALLMKKFNIKHGLIL